MKKLTLIFVTLFATALLAQTNQNTKSASKHAQYAPGSRVQILAHNAYPDHGKYEDRLDRAIASGTPFVVEEDLAWVDGRSLLIHGSKNVTAEDPTLETYFFPKVKAMMEKALKQGNKGNWPLVTLYLDIKNDPPEHLEAISKMLDNYDAWLTTAVKTNDIAKQSPLQLKPMMVLVEDKQKDIKQDFFYERVPVGGKIRVFGSVTKPMDNPNKLPKQEWIDSLSTVEPQQIATAKADNYHRWWGLGWEYVEKGGASKAGEWNSEKQARLEKFVNYAHEQGFFISFYCLDGYSAEQNRGWDKDYNFPSYDAALIRWQAARKAHVDFLSTDQYEEVAKVIKPSSKMAAGE